MTRRKFREPKLVGPTLLGVLDALSLPKSTGALARELGATARTVRRRLDRMEKVGLVRHLKSGSRYRMAQVGELHDAFANVEKAIKKKKVTSKTLFLSVRYVLDLHAWLKGVTPDQVSRAMK